MLRESEEVLQKLKQVIAICTVFIILQIVGGVLANSVAIISDALHLLSDVAAFALSAFVVWLSTQKPPQWLTFGYRKAQPLGALLNIVTIYVVTAYLFLEATERIANKESVQKPSYMLITAVFGLACNLIMMRILHSDGAIHHEGCTHHHAPKNNSATEGAIGFVISGSNQSSTVTPNGAEYQLVAPIDFAHHDHDHCCDSNKPLVLSQLQVGHQQSRTYNQQHVRTQDNLNIQAAYIHILGDIILSIGVTIAATVIYLTTNQGDPYSYIHLADPICTYLFSVLVLVISTPILKKSVIILLDGCLDPILAKEITQELQLLKTNYKDLRLWSVSSNEHLASLMVPKQANTGDIQQIKAVFARHGVKLTLSASID